MLEELERGPVPATVKHPKTGEPVTVQLSRDAFAEALRVIMYHDHRDIPQLIDNAFQGDYDSLAQKAVERNRALRGSLAFGMLLCVTCAEDIDRITLAAIARETRGTFHGDGRVRRQIEVCRFWPRSTNIGPEYGRPVQSDVPGLFFSGTLDPVTPPRWGAEAAGHFRNGHHVVAPGSHGVAGGCIESIMRAFLERPTAELDTSCVEEMRPAPFRVQK